MANKMKMSGFESGHEKSYTNESSLGRRKKKGLDDVFLQCLPSSSWSNKSKSKKGKEKDADIETEYTGCVWIFSQRVQEWNKWIRAGERKRRVESE